MKIPTPAKTAQTLAAYQQAARVLTTTQLQHDKEFFTQHNMPQFADACTAELRHRLRGKGAAASRKPTANTVA